MRTMPDAAFSGDDGSASPDLAAALAAYDADPDAGYAGVLVVLQDVRLLVPVVARLGEAGQGAGGQVVDKSSEMATVLQCGRDGRLALLAFTGVESMARWDPKARPVPAAARQVARAAVQEGADALLVDASGPVLFVADKADVAALAGGYRLMEVAGAPAWVGTDDPAG